MIAIVAHRGDDVPPVVDRQGVYGAADYWYFLRPCVRSGPTPLSCRDINGLPFFVLQAGGVIQLSRWSFLFRRGPHPECQNVSRSVGIKWSM